MVLTESVVLEKTGNKWNGSVSNSTFSSDIQWLSLFVKYFEIVNVQKVQK